MTLAMHRPLLGTIRSQLASAALCLACATAAAPSALAQLQYFKASNTDKSDRFGISLAASGDLLVVGAPGESSASAGIGGIQTDNSLSASGAAYVFLHTGTQWIQHAYIKSDVPRSLAAFGQVVDIDGDTIVVGAPKDRAIATNAQVGAAYVFRRSGNFWFQEARLQASNADSQDQFGASVAISGDVIVVGAHQEASAATGVDGDGSDNGAYQSGAAYVFRRSAGTWTQEAYLKASNTDSKDGFGNAVAIDGDTIAVSASNEDSAASGIDGDQTDNSKATSGAVYVFALDGQTWSQQAYVKASNPDAADTFGSAIDLAGSTLAVGAIGERSHAAGIDGDESDNSQWNTGAMYVFARQGVTWTQQAYIKASNPDQDDVFGMKVKLSGDVLATTASNESSASSGVGGDQLDNSAFRAGASYVFKRSAGSWSQLSYVKATNPESADEFGLGLGLSGNLLFVGAPGEDSASTGIGGDPADNSLSYSGAAYLLDLGFDCNGNGTSDFLDIAAGTSQDCNHSGYPDECEVAIAANDIDGDGQLDTCSPPALMAKAYEVSVSSGGFQDFILTTPYPLDLYLLMGTFSGTTPGIPSGGFQVPLNFDSYLLHTASYPNQAPLTNSFGVLSAPFPSPGGTGTARFTLPSASDPSLVGLTLHHAFITLDYLNQSLTSTSNAVPLSLIP